MIEHWIYAEALESMTLEQALEVIEDGLSFGFEFKVSNNMLLYRELSYND